MNSLFRELFMEYSSVILWVCETLGGSLWRCMEVTLEVFDNDFGGCLGKLPGQNFHKRQSNGKFEEALPRLFNEQNVLLLFFAIEADGHRARLPKTNVARNVMLFLKLSTFI